MVTRFTPPQRLLLSFFTMSQPTSLNEKALASEKLHDVDLVTPEYQDVEAAPQQHTLKRQLKNRHIAMIRFVVFPSSPAPAAHSPFFPPPVSVVCLPDRAKSPNSVSSLLIPGVIGTGLFLGTAGALQNGGPIGLLLGYSIVGTICYSVMVGPMASLSCGWCVLIGSLSPSGISW